MDRYRVFRLGTLLFAMTTVGLLAVQSRQAGVLASEMWPAGLAAAAVFTARRRDVAPVTVVVLVLASATFWIGGRPGWVALGSGLGVALEALVIAWILTSGGTREPSLCNDRDFTRLVLAVLTGGSVAAVLTMGTVAAFAQQPVLLVGVGTLVGHASSAILLLPFFVITDQHEAIAARLERIVQWLLAVAVTCAVFVASDFPALLFAVIPVLGWVALRGSLREAQLQVLVVASVGTLLTMLGRGPLSEIPGRYALPDDVTGIVLQAFVMGCALVVIPLSLAVGQQLEAARQARLERDRAHRIFESATGVAIIGTDRHGRITLFNPGGQRLLGYTPEEVLGKHITMFHTQEAVAEKAAELGVPADFDHVVGAMVRPGCESEEVRFLTRSGEERTHSMTLNRVVDDRGELTGYVSTSEDITDRIRAQDAVVEALATERRAVDRLREVDQVKDSFVSSVSHELRTPITSIMGYLELLEDGTYGALNADQLDALGRVTTNSRRLLLLIDELLTLSRVQEAGLGLGDRMVDLGDVVRTAYDLVAPISAKRRLDVALHLPAHTVPLSGDEDMLERVVANLLGNAVKFTPDGGAVSVRLSTEDHCAVIEVSDTGIGIPIHEQELLFTRFFRSSVAQEQAIPGSGLGLSIARAIVEMHGGTVGVESELGRGTTFRVLLPTGG